MHQHYIFEWYLVIYPILDATVTFIPYIENFEANLITGHMYPMQISQKY
jgi:hypothetical protein